mmetsp:Transcript_81107/g.219687  ORF Transcript_81107/g.219687 Transcript_81107/m.219687 type:complete len:237 (-) Transcript_81107:241-951(-)
MCRFLDNHVKYIPTTWTFLAITRSNCDKLTLLAADAYDRPAAGDTKRCFPIRGNLWYRYRLAISNSERTQLRVAHWACSTIGNALLHALVREIAVNAKSAHDFLAVGQLERSSEGEPVACEARPVEANLKTYGEIHCLTIRVLASADLVRDRARQAARPKHHPQTTLDAKRVRQNSAAAPRGTDAESQLCVPAGLEVEQFVRQVCTSCSRCTADGRLQVRHGCCYAGQVSDLRYQV